MNAPTTIHVIAASRIPLLPALTRIHNPRVSVRWWSAAPSRVMVRQGDLLVVDLLDGGPPVSPLALVALMGRARGVLVTGSEHVAPEWMQLARHPSVEVIRSVGERLNSNVDALASAVWQQLNGPSAARIADLVLKRDPCLMVAEELVRAICEHPWETRHPRHIAQYCGLGMGVVKKRCQQLGFHRVEHFIVAVRMIALEQLVARERVTVLAARRLVGLGSSSNVLRQMTRARVGSAEAFLRLTARAS